MVLREISFTIDPYQLQKRGHKRVRNHIQPTENRPFLAEDTSTNLSWTIEGAMTLPLMVHPVMVR